MKRSVSFTVNYNLQPALALRLFRAAGLKPNGRVLGEHLPHIAANAFLNSTDVGYGSGDSILLQLSHPEVPRPALLCGITSLPSHHRRSRERVNRFLSSPDAPERTPEVHLFEGDAIWRPGHRDRGHPLSPQYGHEFDNILALDCAYHFDSRREFLRRSFQRLAPGGSVALADICFSNPPRAALKFFLSGVLHVMPRSNIVTKEQYLQQMYEIGYENIGVEDITPFVFPGFRAFLTRRGIIGRLFAGIMGWLQGRGLCFVIIEGRKPFAR